MNERCSVCDLKFEREPGYFLGAMYVSYGLGLVIVMVFAALLWSITGWWITKDTIWAVFLFLPLASIFIFTFWKSTGHGMAPAFTLEGAHRDA